MEKSEKKPKEMDRISTLPDSVLCHILSFLPTRASMATSILSRRWRHLWKDLQVLDVEQDQSFRVPDGERHFIDFVDAVLARRTSPHIRKFHLSCCRVSQPEVLDRWSSSIGPHLQELQLSLPSCNPYHRRRDESTFWKCPGGALTSKSLVSLVLNGCVDLNYHYPVQDVHLPSLKNLEVNVCLMNIDKVLSGCPVVENLKLVLHNIPNPSRIRIPGSVKRLTLDDKGVDDFDDVVDIEIDTPSLEYLNLLVGRENICPKILVRDFLNLVEAHLFNGQYVEDGGGWVPELFKALYMTNSLSLSHDTMECLRPAPGLEIPEFCRLVHLDFCSYDFNGKLLLEFLHKCNMLQVLIYRRGDYDYEDEPVDRTPPTKVPNCLISYLKTFEFDGYLDSEDERAFIAYVLQEGLVLKTMKIRSEGFDINKKFLVLKELSAIPRGSKTCQLIFD